MKKKIYTSLTLCLLLLSFVSCGSDSDSNGGEMPPVPETPSDIYIDETFGKSFGEFSLENVSGTPWVIDYGSATATGYDSKSKETTPSDSYLVSLPVDLSKSKGAYISFQYILRYYTSYGTPYGDLADQVLVTDNYTGNPKSTKWIDISGTLSEGADWNNWYEYSMNIPSEFVGKKKVVFALHYACGDKSATWEVRNFVVKEGKVSEPENPFFAGSGNKTNTNGNDVAQQKEVGRLEFPRLKGGNSLVIVHRTNDSYGVNYAVEWDCDKKSQRWTCYELYRGFGGSVGRYDKGYPEDPDLAADYRWDRDYYKGSGYDHGHLCPSADRQYSVEANKQTFYMTNMQPQKHNFNAGVWQSMEERVRRWIALSPVTDTLFVCKGGTIDAEEQIIERISNKLIVPKFFYMAVLYKSVGGYKAIAFWAEHDNVDNSKDDLRKYTISIDALESRTGIDFFCNLPDDVEGKVESTADTKSWTW